MPDFDTVFAALSMALAWLVGWQNAEKDLRDVKWRGDRVSCPEWRVLLEENYARFRTAVEMHLIVRESDMWCGAVPLLKLVSLILWVSMIILFLVGVAIKKVVPSSGDLPFWMDELPKYIMGGVPLVIAVAVRARIFRLRKLLDRI